MNPEETIKLYWISQENSLEKKSGGVKKLTCSLEELRFQISYLVASQLQHEDLWTVDGARYPEYRYMIAGHDAQVSSRLRTGA